MGYFKNTKGTYITIGIAEAIPFSLQMLLWCILEEAKQKMELDYFQVFKLNTKTEEENTLLEITHIQEQPTWYEEKIQMPTDGVINEKVYVIDDGENVTMLLAKEY